MKDIELIDLLLRHSKGNAVVVKKVEVYVAIKDFKDSHITAELFEALNEDNCEYYIYGEALYVKRTNR